MVQIRQLLHQWLSVYFRCSSEFYPLSTVWYCLWGCRGLFRPSWFYIEDIRAAFRLIDCVWSTLSDNLYGCNVHSQICNVKDLLHSSFHHSKHNKSHHPPSVEEALLFSFSHYLWRFPSKLDFTQQFRSYHPLEVPLYQLSFVYFSRPHLLVIISSQLDTTVQYSVTHFAILYKQLCFSTIIVLLQQ